MPQLRSAVRWVGALGILFMILQFFFVGRFKKPPPAPRKQQNICQHTYNPIRAPYIPLTPPKAGKAAPIWNSTDLAWVCFEGEEPGLTAIPSHPRISYSATVEPVRVFRSTFVWYDGSFAIYEPSQKEISGFYFSGGCNASKLNWQQADLANFEEETNAILLESSGSISSPFHRTIEVLTRLAPLATSDLLKTQAVPLLTNPFPDLAAWLRLLGIPVVPNVEQGNGLRIRAIPRNGIRVDELWVPPRSPCGLAPSGGILRQFSRLVRQTAAADCDDGEPWRAVYVKGKGTLESSTEQALLDLLQEASDSQPFTLTPDTPLAEARCVFRSAELVVGASDDLMSLLVFSSPKTAVVGIYPAHLCDGAVGWTEGCQVGFLDLALALGLPYYALNATNTSQHGQVPSLSICNSDFVNLAAVTLSAFDES